MDALQEIDAMLERLNDLVEEARARAEADGCDYLSLRLEWSTRPGDGPKVHVWVDKRGDVNGQLIVAPTASDAYAEALRRINWQRDMNMKRIA